MTGLDGIPTDGGFYIVDSASCGPRVATPDAFMFSEGPSQRLVAEVAPGGTSRVQNIWPGGVSERPGAPGHSALLTG